MTDRKYIISISKEDVGAMPLMTYPGSITVVDTPEEACAALAELAQCSVVGFDTETKPSFHKGCRHKVALMQISTEEMCYLFRLNKIGIGEGLKAFIENPEIKKIGLSVHDDFGVLRRTDESIEPQGFVDLQEMVKDYDITDISLQKVYGIVFGERISKGQRLTNWEADSLTPAQQAYAALDAWACLKLYEYFSEDRFNPLTSPYRHLQEDVAVGQTACEERPEETSSEVGVVDSAETKLSKSARRRLRRKKARDAKK